MKGQWESNINVWFPFMYSQKLNCVASLFPKQKYKVLSPYSYTHIPVIVLYISRIRLSILLQPNIRSWEYINRSQTHECRSADWGRAVSFLGTHKLNFRYSAPLCSSTINPLISRNAFIFTGNAGQDGFPRAARPAGPPWPARRQGRTRRTSLQGYFKFSGQRRLL